MFEEYIGKNLAQRHKYIGLKYARKHGYPEIIGPRSYGIVFMDDENATLVFCIRYESWPVYNPEGKPAPGRNVKTITEIQLEGQGYTENKMAEAKSIAGEYLKLAVEDEEE